MGKHHSSWDIVALFSFCTSRPCHLNLLVAILHNQPSLMGQRYFLFNLANIMKGSVPWYPSQVIHLKNLRPLRSWKFDLLVTSTNFSSYHTASNSILSLNQNFFGLSRHRCTAAEPLTWSHPPGQHQPTVSFFSCLTHPNGAIPNLRTQHCCAIIDHRSSLHEVCNAG